MQENSHCNHRKLKALEKVGDTLNVRPLLEKKEARKARKQTVGKHQAQQRRTETNNENIKEQRKHAN